MENSTKNSDPESQVKKSHRVRSLRVSAIYLACAIFTLIFGIVYTQFGYGVTSVNMDFAFAWLLIGVALYAALAFAPAVFYPQPSASVLLAYSLACLTIYSIINGILDIAGAFSNAAVALPVSAGVLAVAAVAVYVAGIINSKRRDKRQ